MDARPVELSSVSGYSTKETVHSRSRRVTRTSGRHSADSPRQQLEPAVASAEPPATPDPQIPLETQQWADQVLTELRHAEPAMLDPDDAPGGKWGMAAAGTAAVIVALLIVYTVLGFFIGR